MKKIICLLFVLLHLSMAAQQWTTLTSGTTARLTDVFFTSADTGFIIGTDSLLLRTTDRGATWTIANPLPNASPGDLAAIWMFPNGAGFATGVYQVSVQQTSNFGNQWYQINGASNPCFPDGLFFNSPTDGYLYGKGCFGGAYVSHWNGSSWGTDRMLNFEYLSNGTYVQVNGMAHNPNTTNTLAVCNGGRIYRSSTNFQTWDTIPYSDTTNFSAIDYAGGTTFYAVATDANLNNVLISTDDGQTFVPDPTFPLTFFYPQFRDIDLLNNGFGVVGGFSPTTGGGILQVRNTTGWSTQIETTNQPIHAVFVVDSTLAFAVGDSGSIYRYENLPSGISTSPEATTQLQISPSLLTNNTNLTITFPINENFVLDVINTQGQICGRIVDCSGTMQLDIQQMGLVSGMYFLRASGNQSVLTNKFMIGK